ncbi:hypothetical protein, variant 2 [Aphanomyces astaci]|uniref:PWWP domain-containing protein n=1 Tax=Aphanomyces astaci TaxID=112090 RepID=W4H4E2_APHAT|nr:hypothetical protein, variant 2 [Aphanomyces astaci]ETV86762.1 hypothetical protein, variant 2 [Aphanomyces astaci]|eukprot:XP_009823560.1 hypothetical protein, variant 2 [Aphanomyces astaci]
MTTASPVAFDTMAWVLTDGHPWWPVYVINPAHIPPELKAFGQLERESAETANADDTRVHLVFNFGRHTLSVHNMDAMKAWNCTQHPTLLQGYPMSAFRKRGNIAEFRDAMKEAMVFDAEDIATRRLPLSEPHNMDKENQDPSTPNRELVSAKADGDLPGPVCTVDITSPTGPSLTTPIHGDDNDECHISPPPPSQPSDGGIELPPQGVALGSKANASPPPFLAVPDEPCTTIGAPQVEPSPVDASDLPPREGPLECPNVVDEPVASSSATDGTAHADVSDTVATPQKSDSAADEATITQNNEEEVDGMLLAGTSENDGTVITEIVSSLVDRVITAVLPMSSKEDDEKDAIAGKQAEPSDDVALDTARISLPDQGYSSSRRVAPAPPKRDDAAEEESGEIAPTGHLVDAPISSPTTADQTKASMDSSSPVGKPAAPIDQFANALADPELMAMADILGISIEPHTPTQQPSVTASSSSVAIASTKAVSQAVSTGESTGSPVVDSMGVDTMAWVKRGAGPWWPVYVCDPTTVRQKLKLSGPNHNMMLYRATTHPDIRLVYFFGLNKLGSTKLSARRIKAWNCAEQNALMFPPISHLESKATLDAFRAAVTEAQAYVDSSDKVLPALSTAAHAAEATPTKRSLDVDGRTADYSSDDEDAAVGMSVEADHPPLPVGVVAWARANNGPYWPVYLCDPTTIQSKLRHLGNRHAALLTRARKHPHEYRLAYVFGKHEFALHKVSGRMKEWNCPDQLELMQGEHSGLRHEELFEDFSLAVIEAEQYLAADDTSRTLPQLTKADMGMSGDDDDTSAALSCQGLFNEPSNHRLELDQGHADEDGGAVVDVPFDCLAWGRSRGYPWWPAYVCDPLHMRPDLVALGGLSSSNYSTAKRNLTGCRLVYYFGRNAFGLLKARVKPWMCGEHATYARGHPIEQLAAPSMDALFTKAKAEALAFLDNPASAFSIKPSPLHVAILPSITGDSPHVAHPYQSSSSSDHLVLTEPKKRGRPPKPRDGSADPPSKRSRCAVTTAPSASDGVDPPPTDSTSGGGGGESQHGNADDRAPNDGLEPTDSTEWFSNAGESSEHEDGDDDDDVADVANGSVGWTRPPGSPWWPVFVCDPSLVRDHLHFLGDAHQAVLDKAKHDPNVRLVFYFGMHKLGLVKGNSRIRNLKPWKCRDFHLFVQGYPAGTVQGSVVAASFFTAVQEAHTFVASDENTRVLPRMVPSDMDPLLEPPAPARTTPQDSTSAGGDVVPINPSKKRPQILANIPIGQVAWCKPSRSPWWPVYVCDPANLRQSLHHLGKQHRSLLVKAQQNPTDTRLVYYFGRYIFGLVKLNGKIKPWRCVEHGDFLHGFPEVAMDTQDVVDEFYNALKEAEDYLAADEDTRLLPFFVESDTNLDLDPPPPCADNPHTDARGHNADTTVANEQAGDDEEVPPGNHERSSNQATSIPHDAVSDVVPTTDDHGDVTSLDYFGLYTTPPMELPVTRNIAIQEGPTNQVETNHHDEPDSVPQSTKEVASAALPLESLVWARWADGSWWPAYVCDPHKLRDTLHNLGTRHHYDNKWTLAKKSESGQRLVYYFGRYCFGLQKKTLQPWKCADHATFLRGLGRLAMQNRDTFIKALMEAQDFDACDATERLPPHMVPSDINPLVDPPSPETAYFVPDERAVRSEKAKVPSVVLQEAVPAADVDIVAWAKSDGYPWWPVYICDPDKVKHTLYALGNGHDFIYNEAVRKPKILRIVYFFGSHRFGLSEVHPKAIQTWQADNHAVLLQGVPKKLMQRKGIVDVFATAMDETNKFIASNEPVLVFPDVVDEELQHDTLDQAQRTSSSVHESKPDKAEPVDTIAFDTVAWAYLSGFPWLPVYVFDPFRLKPELEHLGSRHAEVLKEAQQHADTYRIVYYFGSHNFGLHKTPNVTLRHWGCAEHDTMCLPTPSKAKRSSFRSQVKKALAEADTYLASSERIRLLPKFTASDMYSLASADRLRVSVAKTQAQRAHREVPRGSRPPPSSKAARPKPPSPTKARAITTTKPSTATKSTASRGAPPIKHDVDSDDSETFEKLLIKHDKALKSKAAKPSVDLIPYNCLAWALLEGYPWLPVFVLDPFTLQADLHLLGSGHGASLRKAKKHPDRYRIVYYFCSHNFGLHTHPATTLRPWNCHEHASFLTGFPKRSCRGKKILEDLVDGVREADCFAAAAPDTRLLPYMVPSDTNPTLAPPSPQFVPYNSLAWAITEGFPWMPVYVFDPFQLRSKLTHLGSGHRDLLRRARAAPETTRLVFYFGSHSFGLHKFDGTLKPWNCSEHGQYLEAKADSLLYIKKSVIEQFDIAMDEVEVFSSMDEGHRLLPYMDPSDFDNPPTLSQPPSRHVRTAPRSREASPPRKRAAKRLRLSNEDVPSKSRAQVAAAHERAVEVKRAFEARMAWVQWDRVVWWPVYICESKPVHRYVWDSERQHMESTDYSSTLVHVYHFGTKAL